MPVFHSPNLRTLCSGIPEYKVLKFGDNKLPAKVFDSNFFLLVCRLGRGKQGWLQAGEDMCGCSRKVARFEIVRNMDFKLQQEIHTQTTKCGRFIWKQRLIAEDIGRQNYS
jgi:hypothetical protein